MEYFRGEVHDKGDKDKGENDDDSYLLAGTLKGGNFEHIPVPEELGKVTNTGKHVFVLSMTGWEMGSVQEIANMVSKQNQKEKGMELPVIVKYDNGS